jgi:hypothetical protein
MNEYGWTLDQALDLPIRQALCLHTVIALRHGYTWAKASYVERDI